MPAPLRIQADASGTLVITVSDAPLDRAKSTASARACSESGEPSMGTRMLRNTRGV
jgi:hypothetical protein